MDQVEDQPLALDPSGGHAPTAGELGRADKIARTQRRRWAEVDKARRARELLRQAEPIIRQRAELGETAWERDLAKHIADRLEEVL